MSFPTALLGRTTSCCTQLTAATSAGPPQDLVSTLAHCMVLQQAETKAHLTDRGVSATSISCRAVPAPVQLQRGSSRAAPGITFHHAGGCQVHWPAWAPWQPSCCRQGFSSTSPGPSAHPCHLLCMLMGSPFRQAPALTCCSTHHNTGYSSLLGACPLRGGETLLRLLQDPEPLVQEIGRRWGNPEMSLD